MAKRNHEKILALNCKTKPKVFWRYVQAKVKNVSGISPLQMENGELAVSNIDKANTLNEYFSTVFIRENVDDMPPENEGLHTNGAFVTELRVTPDAVTKLLNKLNKDKAQGPDKIPPRVLKELSVPLGIPLSILFNKSLDEGQLPQEWRSAEVTAIFKKGTKSSPGNYRPVSLTSVLCKVIESFIREVMVKHMSDYHLYSDCQHGFRKGRSCTTQLLQVMEDLTQIVDNGYPIDIIYLDFKKAFDQVPHQRLLCKLLSYGFTGNILKWIANFLASRTQVVRVGNDYSSSANVLSGIPQGSILGPLLFTIFINDLPDGLSGCCKIFADDTKLYDVSFNHVRLQNDINSLQIWSDKWKFFFNMDKCKVMQAGKCNPRHDYFMHNETETILITKCSEEKDLGVIFDENLLFDSHIQSIINKSNQMIGIIRRTFTYLNRSIFLHLYKALVRPHLEYGHEIWFPRLKRQSVAIEKVQRRATKLLSELKDLTYTERMEILMLPSLKCRRIRGDMILVYKIMNGLVDIDWTHFFTLTRSEITRGSKHKLFIEYSRTNTRKYTFSNRTVTLWNALSDNTKAAPSLNIFKNKLDNDAIFKPLMYEYDE